MRYAITVSTVVLAVVFLCVGVSEAGDVSRFLGPKAWQCTFQAELNSERSEATGPGGMAYGPRRRFFQTLGATGVKAEPAGGYTDSYMEKVEQTLKGRIRLHHTYDGGPDGIQIAGWNNGGAEVHVRHYFEGTEQKKTIMRDKTITYDGPAMFEGEEYEPPFQIWINPEQGTYAIEYHLSPVSGDVVEHCRMKEEMEPGRKKMESATDAEMPLGSFFSGLTKFSCPTERKGKVKIEGGALSAVVSGIPVPSSLIFEGEGESEFIDARGVKFQWSCRPE